MKAYKSRGKPGQFNGNNKGAKYKRFKWKKNNFKFAGQAKFGVGVNQNDDDDNFNYNLIGTDLVDIEEQESMRFPLFYFFRIKILKTLKFCPHKNNFSIKFFGNKKNTILYLFLININERTN